MIHSTTSPLANSMAWATAEGKLISYYPRALWLMSWTLDWESHGGTEVRCFKHPSRHEQFLSNPTNNVIQ